MAKENAPSLSPNFLSTPKSKTSTKKLCNYIISYFVYILIIPAIFSAVLHYHQEFLYIVPLHLPNYVNHPATIFILLSTMTMTLVHVILHPRRRVYLLDFSCYKHDPSFWVSMEANYEKLSAYFSPESLAFTRRVVEKNGTSDKTFIYGMDDFPPKSSFACALGEAETVISGAVDDLMSKTGVDPGEIGVVIVNISTFNLVPSLSAMIVNRYKLPEDVLTYNLGGMGCSAGLIALDLAKRLLQEKRNTYALIMSLECPTAAYYLGDDRSKLLPNCLFRMGGAAILLSNHPSDRRASKYELTHTVRTHLGANDRAYKCVFQEPDHNGSPAVTLTKDLMAAAGEALKANISALAPLVLPPSEKVRFVAALIGRRVLKMKGAAPYVPDLTAAFEHLCIHAGGKAVLDAVEKKLNLSEWDMEPSRMTLYRYWNTSSSSLWYELAYAEAKGRVRKGDRVWQIGFGSGFKCASGVWRALRTINPNEELDNPWTQVIHHYPIPQPARD